ncbi:MAG TPA: SDR family oxidoreductase [Myxococcaceae bacterium]|nr:SDR family oxidoreductase [Myxococcaceae bacterium]
MARTIGIIGGHGKVALLLEPLLVEAGYEVRAYIRNPNQRAEVEATGAQAVIADIEALSTDDMAVLFEGLYAIVWSAGAGGGNPARTQAVDRDAAIRSIDAAKRAGVGRYVMVSYFGAGKDHGVSPDNPFFHYAEAKSAADAYLEASGLEYTILRPSGLTLEPPSGSIGVEPAQLRSRAGTVSRANVARAILHALDTPTTIRQVYAFNDGPTPIAEALR